MVLEIHARNEVKIWIRGHSQKKNEDKQSCQPCMQHFAPTCSVILPYIIKIFQTAAELCSENELKICIREGN